MSKPYPSTKFHEALQHTRETGEVTHVRYSKRHYGSILVSLQDSHLEGIDFDVNSDTKLITLRTCPRSEFDFLGNRR